MKYSNSTQFPNLKVFFSWFCFSDQLILLSSVLFLQLFSVLIAGHICLLFLFSFNDATPILLLLASMSP